MNRAQQVFLAGSAFELRSLGPEAMVRSCLSRLRIPEDPPRRLYLGTILENMTEKQERFKSRDAFSPGEEPTLRGLIRNAFGNTIPLIRVNAACAGGAAALVLASQAILYEDLATVAVLGYDEASALARAGFTSLRTLGHGRMMSFTRARDGFTLAPGCGAMLLTRQPASPIRLRGVAVTNDAHHPTGPHREGAGLKRCIEDCLASAGRDARDVACLRLNGSATRQTDAAEYQALVSVFGPSLRGVPAYVLKPKLNYLQGAAGVVETAIAARLLERGLVPAVPRALVQDLEFDLGLSAQPRRMAGNNCLLLFAGFGGQNVCLLLEKA